MSITCIILGESGSGKTSSLRNFDGSQVALIQTIQKPLPFRPTGWTTYVTDDFENIKKAMTQAAKNGKKVIVIDDFQYLMCNEFMNRAYEGGYSKYTEIARHAWEVITCATHLPEDVRVYILSHTTTGDDGTVRLKTIGKLLDEKITVEGLVTIVLRTAVMDGDYRFRVVNSGSDTVKSPMGMFKEETIENDLKKVDDTIVDYYGIGGNK